MLVLLTRFVGFWVLDGLGFVGYLFVGLLDFDSGCVELIFVI